MGSEEDVEETIKLNLRLPPELHAALTARARARRTRRSLNNEITMLLERFINSVELGLSQDDASRFLAILSRAVQEEAAKRKLAVSVRGEPGHDVEADHVRHAANVADRARGG